MRFLPFVVPPLSIYSEMNESIKSNLVDLDEKVCGFSLTCFVTTLDLYGYIYNKN